MIVFGLLGLEQSREVAGCLYVEAQGRVLVVATCRRQEHHTAAVEGLYTKT